MMVPTASGEQLDARLVGNYFRSLVNLIFKILPMRESGEESLPVYLQNLRSELAGCGALIHSIKYDPSYLSILATLQYLIDTPDCPVADVRREVFGMISTCKKIARRYGDEVIR